MKYLFIILSVFFLQTNIFAQHHHDHKHGHGANANEYMHQSSMDELIERFESPERDAYQMPDKVLDAIGDLKGKTVMDIGAGSGYFSVKLARRAGQVIAADVSKEAGADAIGDHGALGIGVGCHPTLNVNFLILTDFLTHNHPVIASHFALYGRLEIKSHKHNVRSSFVDSICRIGCNKTAASLDCLS